MMCSQSQLQQIYLLIVEMGNKQHRAQSVQANNVNGDERSSLPVFNCLALSSVCCNYEVQARDNEIDQTRNGNNGIQTHQSIASQFSLSHKKDKKGREPSTTQFCQDPTQQGTEQMSLISPGIRATDLNVSPQPSSMNPSASQAKKIKKSASNRIMPLEPKTSEWFNNRNQVVMSARVSSNEPALELRLPKTNSVRLLNGQRLRANTERRIAEVGEENEYFVTDSNASHLQEPQGKNKKVALTEVCQSEGDTSPPDVQQEDIISAEDSQTVPQELRNLDQDDALEIQSMHSHRLYTFSPSEYNKNKTKHRNVKKKLLYPDLVNYKPPVKEASRLRDEFNRTLTKLQKQKKTFFQRVLSKEGSYVTANKSKQKAKIDVESLPIEVRCFVQNTRKRLATVTLQSGSVFVGEFNGSGAQGLGFCQEPDRSYYYGHWVDGMKSGKGTYVKRDVHMYKGGWLDDQMHGQGTMKQANGTVYKGEWEFGRPHGQGDEIFADKSRYVGQFIKGKKDGSGELIFPDGGVYKGQFHKNQICGVGIYKWPTGIIYEGEWINNKKNGKGMLKWLDGSREYRGEFKNDERHGQGVYVWEHGTKSYRGTWRNGLKDGIGYVRDEFDYVERKGLWFCDKLVKWMPKEEDDEGQDGESVVSQDIADWEGQTSNFQSHNIRHGAHLSYESAQGSFHQNRTSIASATRERPIMTSARQPEETKVLTVDQLPFQTEPAMLANPLTRRRNMQNQSNEKLRQETGVSSKERRTVPTFKKATEEVKRLTVKRNKIKKRISTQDRSTSGERSQYAPQSQRGMLSLERRVKLVGGKDLALFNPPQVWSEIRATQGTELPSPHFKDMEFNVVDVDASASGFGQEEEEEQNEYFMFNANVDDADPEESF